MKKNKITLGLLLLFTVLTASLAIAGNVAYVYKNSLRLNHDFINALTEKGFTVDLVTYAHIDEVNFNNYDLILVGDESFLNPALIPVNKYPSIIVNSYHMSDWGWLDSNGISTIGSNQPLKAKNVVNHTIRNGLPDLVQIYTQCCVDGSSLALSSYYLHRYSKDPDVLTVTSTTVNNNDAIIGVVEPGKKLFYGITAQARGCFFGAVESDYWTANAKTLFQNCALWAAYGADKDGDGYFAEQDCNDNDANINPGKTEIIYNGKDDDCNPLTLDDDLDKDAYLKATDCNDNNNAIHPNAAEVPYDGIDQDCNGADLTDVDYDGYAAIIVGGTDCNDNNAQVYPGAVETPYDGIDQNCDGYDLADVDLDGYCKSGYNINNKALQCAKETGTVGTDCNDNDANVNPEQIEIPLNQKDDDCNPSTFDNDLDNDSIDGDMDNCPNDYNPLQEDEDSDGIGDVCDTYPNDFDNDGYNITLDCDDSDQTIYPGAQEILDNIDQNCLNDAPYLDDFSAINVIATQTAIINAVGHDVDGNTLTYSINDTRFTKNNNVFTWQTSLNDAGQSITATVTVSDGLLSSSKQVTVNVQPKLVINEFAFDPKTDWNGNGYINNNDRWVELFNPSNTNIDLSGWKIKIGTFTLTTNNLAGTLAANDYYVLLNPLGSITYSAGEVSLYKGDVQVDKIIYGSLNDGNLSDNAFRYDGVNSSSIYNECVARMPNGRDTNKDNEDFVKQQCTYSMSNEADLIPPVVNLISPANSYIDIDGSITFTFSATDTVIKNCSLYTDITGLFKREKTINVNNNYIEGSFTLNPIPDNKIFKWNVECTDEYRNSAFAASNRTATIDINDAPELELYSSVDKKIGSELIVNETDLVLIIAIGSDNDGDTLIYSINDSRFSKANNIFKWQTGASNGESFSVNIMVSDGELTDYQEVMIIVLNNDNDNDGYDNSQDCNDNNANINPGRTELDNGIDDDCDGSIDEGYDLDGDGYTPFGGDCNDNNANVKPSATETCNGIDDNCNGNIDEENSVGCVVYYYDGDSDTYGLAGNSKCLCSSQDPYDTLVSGDCNDNNANVKPSATETCNGIDDNCNGQIDEQNSQGCTVYYYDLDRDHYGINDNKCLCAVSGKYDAPVSGDCDDYDPSINPAATEKCDGKDNDCDISIDEEGAQGCTTYYYDFDNDNYGINDNKCLCAVDGYYKTMQNNDCDDNNSAINPGVAEICNNIDDNCNGQIDEGCDNDNDDYCDSSMTYVVSSTCTNGPNDCNDNNANVNPSITESCNGIDDNCNNQIDEENALNCTVYYYDYDNDAYGLTADSKCLCSATGNYDTTVSGDCKDNDRNVHPNADEFCNGIDDDCDSNIDEEGAQFCTTYHHDGDNDNYGLTINTKCLCTISGNYSTTTNGDCNDNDNTVYPGASEIPYDGIDQDCNAGDLNDVDNDGYIAIAAGGNDCNDNNKNIHPSADEFCNGINDDCDGSTDEEGAQGCTVYYLDSDNDNYGSSESKCLCSSASPYDATISGDCDDSDSNVNPSMTEIVYNGKDDDCNPATLDDDLDNDGYVNATDCNDNNPNVNPGMEELCNNIDENCNGNADEGCDDDNDGYCDKDLLVIGSPTTCNNGINDCNDNNNAVYPGASEIPNNGKDDDCNPYTLDNDADQDGVADEEDNCVNVYNPNQLDTDYDGIGNACDSYPNDYDNDGYDDNADTCPDVYNPSQQDTDGDGIGDSCDQYPNDFDNDGYSTSEDCDDANENINPGENEVYYNGIDDDCNLNTADNDKDGDGSIYGVDCDDNNANRSPGLQEVPGNGIDDDCNPLTFDNDADQDGIINENDNCVNVYNPLQEDDDLDGIGDVCDQYPHDYDNDGYDDNIDNCVSIFNPDQVDLDQDGVGDICEHQPVMSLEDITVIEGDTVVINPQASDADNDNLAITISDPVGNDGIWETKLGDKGTYKVTVAVSDGLFTITKTITVTVREKPFEEIQVSRIKLSEEYVRAGDILELFVTVESSGNVKSKEVKISADIPELGIRSAAGRFDLKKQQVTKRLLLDIPADAEKREYDLRIIVSNDNVRRVIHRPFIII